MKKCPFCKADIEDNARFCLYCMRPLNEKEVISLSRKRNWLWLPVAVGAVLIVLLAVLLLLPKGQADLPAQTSGTEEASTPPADSQPEASTEPSQTEGDTQPQASGITVSGQPQTQDGAVVEPPKTPKPTTAPATQPEEKPQATAPETTTPPATEPEETTQPEEVQTPSMYVYRAARAGDDFSAGYSNAGGDVVITGIARQSANGTYDIPSYIDGKRVIAITANAFSGSNARAVFVPSTVKTIWNYAFSGCGLTDIYFRGNAIYVESKAFSGSVTIHCKASCSDRNFRYYKDCAASYGATWAEWNG